MLKESEEKSQGEGVLNIEGEVKTLNSGYKDALGMLGVRESDSFAKIYQQYQILVSTLTACQAAELADDEIENRETSSLILKLKKAIDTV